MGSSDGNESFSAATSSAAHGDVQMVAMSSQAGGQPELPYKQTLPDVPVMYYNPQKQQQQYASVPVVTGYVPQQQPQNFATVPIVTGYVPEQQQSYAPVPVVAGYVPQPDPVTVPSVVISDESNPDSRV